MSGIVGKNAGRSSGSVGTVAAAALADDSVDSDNYVDGSIDNAHIADDAIDSEHYATGSIDEGHIADNAVTLDKMAGGTDGNIISFDASGNPVYIATGSDGQVLTSAGAGAPPAFEAAAGGGKCLQLLSYTKKDTATTTSTSFVDTGLQIAITPSATSSRIMIWVTTLISISAYEQRAYFNITGGNAASYVGDSGSGIEAAFGISPRAGDTYAQIIATGMYLDLPDSTSAITYKLVWRTGSATLYMNRSNANYSDDIISASTITVMEYGA